MILPLVPGTDPVLLNPTQPFDFSNPPIAVDELVTNLKDTLLKEGGLGLSANQVGIPYSVFVFGASNVPDEIVAVFNPKLVDVSEDSDYSLEGCLSFPGLFLKIKRPKSVRVRFTNMKGVTNTFVFAGLTARIMQHEIDHLDGKLFHKRANRYHLEQGLKKSRR